jgi:2,4-dienoyl-CoA reductase (NADPH2)
VLTAWEVLRNSPRLGKSVAIIGGGAVGLETALFVAAKGTINPETLHFLFTHEAASNDRLRELMFRGTSKVTVFEMLPKAGADVGKSTRWVLFDSLDRFGIHIRTSTKVLSIDNGTVIVDAEGNEETLQFDQVIMASGSKSVQRLSLELEELDIPMEVVGDCIKPGKINDAIHGGFLAALKI